MGWESWLHKNKTGSNIICCLFWGSGIGKING